MVYVRSTRRAWHVTARVCMPLLLALPAGAPAQTSVTLTLEEAIGLARRNNPDFLAQEARSATADWAVREAYGALLPGASASSSVAWQDAGTPRFGIFNASDFGLATSTDYYSSSYTVGLSWRLSGATLLGPGREKAGRRATEATIDAAATTLVQNVTGAYLAVLRAQESVTLARQELQRAEENLRLAEARVTVGAGIPLEARQAQVERGRARVTLLQAENDVQVQRVRLGEILGLRLDRGIELTTAFTLTDVPWDLETLLAAAAEAHPQLRAARATLEASRTSVGMARSAYLPTLSLSAGLSGFTRQAGNEDYLIQQAMNQAAGQRSSCELFNQISAGLAQPLPGRPSDCTALALSAQDQARIRAANDVFPFNFSKEPLSMSLTLSLPLFQGFTRERQIEEARVQAREAEYRLRAQQLRLNTQVETAWLALATASQAVEIEVNNRELAEEQLRLARERYRVGIASFLELQDAETIRARADRAHLDAVYTFHASLSDLQAAVGRPLRPDVR